MHEVITRFDRVFDVVRIEAGDGTHRHTLFGFQNSKMRQCGVKVPGWPAIAPDTSYAIVLNSQDNWQSIEGWINLETGEVARNHASASAAITVFSIFVLVMLFLNDVSSWPTTMFLLLTGGIATFHLRKEMTVSRVLKRLCKKHYIPGLP
ncbi:hypothetical protein NMQ14_02130 [Methyloversatilis sp. XJ19-13]|uniref:hypothetical protein n=1 Tax=Methyloversatilis sp. XJ19-13 TaxID=2963430 RepID=UPI00211C4258|nr:hypothetical protein [Methyloversatilis sp. XJ19-13]MCQ9373044.1 hypothetical protein [Methyloversatilis sp. XJ19-13]